MLNCFKSYSLVLVARVWLGKLIFVSMIKSMHKTTLLAAMLFASAPAAFAQTKQVNQTGKPVKSKTVASSAKLVEEVTKSGKTMVIPFKRYVLSNGLNVVVHEDHSDPIVYVDVTYHVGSAREQQGRSGFAHFFEHMMFQGSKNVGDEQHFKIITESGGTLNGTTNTDRTNYFESVPSNQLEKMLWLESDRMGFLLDSVTQRKFEVQRATVKNERGQRYDNAPYGLVSEKLGEALYPKGHPYSWTTIGYIADLDRVDVNDLKRFYMRWYGPNNAVLTVAGDVNTQEVVKLAEKYFGSIPKGPEVKEQVVATFSLESNRYVSYEDNIKFPMLTMAWPSSPDQTKDDAALDVLAEVLSGSQSSPLYKGLIESKKAVSANAFEYTRELAGHFQVMIRANAGASLAETEKEFRAILAEWEKTGVTEDDMQKFKAGFQSNLYNRLATVQGKGTSLASFYTLAGNANYLPKQIEMNLSLTKEDVMAAYNKYIKNKACVVLSCVPKGKPELKAADDNWKMYERSIETESAEYKNLSYTAPIDNFNRSIQPVAGKASPVPVPDYYKTTTAGIIPVIGVSDNDMPVVNMLISFKAGHRYEPAEKSGLSQIFAAMLEQSTTKTSAEEIENKLNRLGSSIRFFSSDDNLSIYVQSLSANIGATLKILEEQLMEPKFDETEFELEKKKQLDGINQSLINASSIADQVYRKLLYPKNSAMYYPSSGSAETVSGLTITDVKNMYGFLNSSIVSVAVSGNISQAEVVSGLDFLKSLRKGSPYILEPIVPANIEKTKIYFVDKKNAAQSEIRMGYLALPYDADGLFYKANVMNFPFAGAFNSRVNYLLREIKGWTYGTRAGFSGSKFIGAYTLSGGFKSNATDSTLSQILRLFDEYTKTGMTEEELNFAKNAIAQGDALKYEAPMQKLSFISRVLEYDLPKDYVAKQMTVLNALTTGDMYKFAQKYLPYNNMIIVVVGDKAANFEKVKQLGLEVIELDVDGNKVN